MSINETEAIFRYNVETLLNSAKTLTREQMVAMQIQPSLITAILLLRQNPNAPLDIGTLCLDGGIDHPDPYAWKY